MVINLWNLVYSLTKTQTPSSHFLLVFAVSVMTMSPDETCSFYIAVEVIQNQGVASECHKKVVWKIGVRRKKQQTRAEGNGR